MARNLQTPLCLDVLGHAIAASALWLLSSDLYSGRRRKLKFWHPELLGLVGDLMW